MSWNKTHSKSLEEKVKRLKEANSELREQIKLLQQPKNNCDTCKWDDYCGTEENRISSKYIKDRYEQKEQ